MENLKGEFEITEEITISGHHESCLSALYYPKLERIVSSSYDGEIRFWDSNSGKQLLPSKNNFCHAGYCRHLIKWDGFILLSCGEDGAIHSLSAFSMKKLEQIVLVGTEVELLSMEKMSSDLLIAISLSVDAIYIISYSKKMVLRKLSERSIHFMSKLVLSKIFKNSVYLNCSYSDKYDIHLINYEENRTIKKFTEGTDWINGMDIYSNYRKEEILVAAGANKKIFFWKTAPSFHEHKSLFHGKLFRTIDLEMPTGNLKVFCNRYIIVTGRFSRNKMWSIFLINDKNESHESEESKCPLVLTKEIHNTYHMVLMKVRKKGIRVLTCSSDHTLKIVNIKGPVDLKSDSFEEKDLLERIGYLRNEFVEMFSNENSSLVISLKIGNCSNLVFKSFIL